MNAQRSGFFAELKRRKVVRVAVVYAATAFVILQAADIMLPRMGIPDWGVGLVVALAVLGFPIALVLAWALELTPDGIKRTESAPAAQAEQGSAPALLGKRTVFLAALLVVLGVGIGTGWFLRPVSGPDGVPGGQSDRAAVPDVSAETSIAVLPFLNMSTDPENAFFADGISEELLNILVGVEGLKVASRTSALSFKSSNAPIPEIARQLGVRHILEGLVRRQDNRVRITAQLITERVDYRDWLERYPPPPGPMEGFFRIQAALLLGSNEAVLQAQNDDRTRLGFHRLLDAAWMPGLVELREAPELFALMSDYGLVDYWEAHGFPRGCRPVDDPAGRRLNCSGHAP